jgi:hypothetical protein
MAASGNKVAPPLALIGENLARLDRCGNLPPMRHRRSDVARENRRRDARARARRARDSGSIIARTGTRLMAHYAKTTSARKQAAPAVMPGVRCPTRDEQGAMVEALDRMLEDEQTLRSHGHNAGHPALYARDVTAVMAAVVDGNPVWPDALWHTLDLLDQLHRMAEVADKGMQKFHEARAALRDMAEAGSDHERRNRGNAGPQGRAKRRYQAADRALAEGDARMLAEPSEVLRIPCGEGGAPRVTFNILVAGARTVTCELNAKSVRKAQATIRELGGDAVACVIQGRLDAKDRVLDGGFQIVPRTPKAPTP